MQDKFSGVKQIVVAFIHNALAWNASLLQIYTRGLGNNKMNRGSWHSVPQSLLTVSLNLYKDKDSPLQMQAAWWCEEGHLCLQRLSAVTDTLTRSHCTNGRFGVSEYSLGNCENLQRTSVHRLTLKILRTKQSGLEWDHSIASHTEQNGELLP